MKIMKICFAFFFTLKASFDLTLSFVLNFDRFCQKFVFKVNVSNAEKQAIGRVSAPNRQMLLASAKVPVPVSAAKVARAKVEEKFGERNFRVLSEMRILTKIRVVILDFVGYVDFRVLRHRF